MFKISGIILAGGQGRRMNQLNDNQSHSSPIEKGLVTFLNQPMIQHVIKNLAPQVDEIIINANQSVEQYAAFGYPVIQDNISGYAGPLAGLHTGMQAAKNAYVLTVPCDSPLLAMDLATRLSTALIKNNADIAVAKTGTQAHPVFCLCNKNLLPHLDHYLQNGGRKFDAWYSTFNVIEVAFDDNPLAFANINTPEDLIKLETAATYQPSSNTP
jgi:molybdopterin-guanine dinucleotide biosynthesis protein A